MKSFLPGALFAAAVVGGALFTNDTSQATTFQVTYTGTVSYGYDTTGVFGTAATELTGESFSATFIFDSTLGYLQPGPTAQYLYGGPGYANTNPMLSANLTVGSNTVALPFSWYGYLQQNLGPAGSFNDYYVETRSDQAGTNYGYLRIGSNYNSMGGGPNIYSPFTYLYDPAEDTRTGYFAFGQFASNAFVYLNANDVTVGPASEVPLPAALPLFASALLGAGVMAWRKRRKQCAVPIAA